MTGQAARRCLVAGALTMALMGCAVQEVRTVEGLVLEVEAVSPTDIEAFTVRTVDGQQLRFALDAVDFGHGGFPATHLREHQALAEPVRVTYRTEGDRNVVVRLEDAD